MRVLPAGASASGNRIGSDFRDTPSSHDAGEVNAKTVMRHHVRPSKGRIGRIRRNTSGALEYQVMETAKDQVQHILQMLPEDASLEDIQYHIYVRQKIQQGLDDGEAGRVISHTGVQQRLAKWLTK